MPTRNPAWCVYALVDDGDDRVAYVGQTSQVPKLRLSQHLRTARAGKRPVSCWLRDVAAAGRAIRIQVLEHCESQSDVNAAERRWIERLRIECGVALVNVRGGGGVALDREVFRQLMAEVATRYGIVQRKREAMRAEWRDATKRAVRASAIAAARRDPACADERSRAVRRSWEGLDAATREARARGLRSGGCPAGRTADLWRDEAHRRMRLTNHREAMARPEVRAAMSRSHKARLASPTARAERSAALRVQWADPEIRERRLLAVAKATETKRRAREVSRAR